MNYIRDVFFDQAFIQRTVSKPDCIVHELRSLKNAKHPWKTALAIARSFAAFGPIMIDPEETNYFPF